MYIKVKKAKEFRSLLLASVSLQELSIVRSCVETVWGSQQVGETLSSSQLSTLRWGEKEWTANVKCSYPCFFSLRAMNIASKIPLSFDLPVLLPRITQLYYSTFHNFWKLKPFINAGLGLVLKYIAFEGKRRVLKWFCFLANVVSVVFSVCLLRHQWKANYWFPLFFAGPSLQAVKRNCCWWW